VRPLETIHRVSRARDAPLRRIDLWLTLLALVACIETLGVCALATWRYSRKVYDVRLQRWTMRIILIGPVYSWLMWVSLWTPELDYYVAIPVGMYEAYSFFCFYAMLVCFADGEDRLVAALGGLPGPPTAFVYHPCGVYLGGCGQYTPLFGGRVHYAGCARFRTARGLLAYLKFGVAQAMVVKPLNVLVMLVLAKHGLVNWANYSRMLSIVSLWLVANSLTQLYHVVLPRVRGLGGEQLFVLLVVMIVVLIVQDIVCSALLINSGSSSATANYATRLVFVLTILEMTVFATIFYRLLPPEKFATLAWTNSTTALVASGGGAPLTPGRPTSMPIERFVWLILDPRTVFSVPRGREPRSSDAYCGDAFGGSRPGSFDDAASLYHGRASFSRSSRGTMIGLGGYPPSEYVGGVKESKRDDDDDDAAAYPVGLVYDEKTPLIKG